MIEAGERLRRYVDATLEGVVADYASLGGGRNAGLRDAAIRLGVLVGRGLLDEGTVSRRLLEAARANGYAAKDGEREVGAVVRRSLRFGADEGTVPDELEAILRDAAVERGQLAAGARSSAPLTAPSIPAHPDPGEHNPRLPPPVEEARRLWETSSSVADDPQASAYLRSRGIDPNAVAEANLARVATGELPPWARGWAGRILVPLYDARGVLRSLLARDATGEAERKSLAPTGYSRKELVMACGRTRGVLQKPVPARLVVLEGEIDFLVAATQRSDADESGAMGITAGAWSPALAQRIADGSELVIAVDSDEAGEKYAGLILDSMKARKVRLSRWRGPEGADLARAGGLASGVIVELDPMGWRSPAQRALELGANAADPMPTGFESLDAATRGGLRGSKLVVAAGAPGAGKTSLCVQLALEYARAGHPVGVLACDEDADGLLIRIGQQLGLVREDLERGILGARRHLAGALAGLMLTLVDADESEATIEDVAERVQAQAAERKKPGVLVVDSIQKARCREHTVAAMRTERERVDATVRSLKRVSRMGGLLTLATSETSRAIYRGGADPKINPLAAGKESGSIEYAAAVQLVLTSVPGESDLVDVAVPKNRIGSGRDGWRMRFDRDRARFVETSVEDAERDDEEGQEQREEAQSAKLEADAEKLLGEVLKARAKGAELKSRHDLRELARGRMTWRVRVIAHLFATGRLVGGSGKPIRPPHGDEPADEGEVPDDS